MPWKRRIVLCGVLGLAAPACVPAAEFQQGQDLQGLRLHPTSNTEGIFPDVSVLDDPNNPFVGISYGAVDAVHNPNALQFAIAASPAHAAAFYIWATVLAQQAPTGSGEAQYYTAAALRDVYDYKQYANPKDAAVVRAMAIAGFTQVLTEFEASAYTYAADGKTRYELLTPALQGLLDLGGPAPSGWFLSRDASGAPRAVRQ